ncbi:MAG TPA: general secretion pathway protein GspK [Bdellovibrionales bacterium]|nr:general secretion pathway protein GspK [Pseudobdellovibrionaceae bacterium]HAG91569.1 general secretion pathway protein GspK [Bdellovibrionales bacterium]|tara:strand:+ start:977 stop:2236 length:1260 start_codon:yes stop_codon:yes gene_type:complete
MNRPGLKNQRGVALLMALMALTLLIWISVELSYDTSVDYVVAANEVNEVKAYYAAKAGVELSLLRIHLYKMAMESLGAQLGPQAKMLDLIWSFPMMWPPTIPEDSKATEVDRSMINAAVGESLMDAQYATSIFAEGGRIDINDLGSQVKVLAQGTKEQLLKVFRSELEHNEDFNKKYSGYNFEELLNNIADYVDFDTESRNGGDERSQYKDLKLSDDVEVYPPNRSFITLDELNMVAGMNDDFYKILKPRITVYGVKGFNVNHATKEMYMALDPTMTEEAVEAVVKRINDPNEGGPFPSKGCKESFLQFISGFGVDVRALEESALPFICDAEVNFRIVSDGVAIRSRKSITAITYDTVNLVGKYTDMLQKQVKDSEETPTAGAGSPSGTDQGRGDANDSDKNQIKASKDRPSVVYWLEN